MSKPPSPQAYGNRGEIYYSLHQVPLFTFPEFIHVAADHVQLNEYIIPYDGMIKGSMIRIKEWIDAWVDTDFFGTNKEWLNAILETWHNRMTEFSINK